MTEWRRIAQRIRHLPGLENADGMWRLVRKPYHRLLNAGGQGTAVAVGGTQRIRIPAEFAGMSWEEYEPEAVAAFGAWIRTHPGGLVLDVGSSIGIFSAIGLSVGSEIDVIAFDSDLASLAATRRLCEHARNGELRLVYGLLTCELTAPAHLPAATLSTEHALARSGVDGDVGTTRYVCLTDVDAAEIPRYSLDELLASERIGHRPMLIKCDVEGAELLVLKGTSRLLERAHPSLLLSIHPTALPQYGHSKRDVDALLRAMDYDIQVIAVDHEEHWWCESKVATA